MTQIPRTSEYNLEQCRLAFARLKDGSPIEDRHQNIIRSKITAGVVSVEAGLDRGYLKKCIQKHHLLLAEIREYRTSEDVSQSDPTKVKYRRARLKLLAMEEELKQCQATMYKVLTQNLQLVETIRRLEQFVKQTEMKM